MTPRALAAAAGVLLAVLAGAPARGATGGTTGPIVATPLPPLAPPGGGQAASPAPASPAVTPAPVIPAAPAPVIPAAPAPAAPPPATPAGVALPSAWLPRRTADLLVRNNLSGTVQHLRIPVGGTAKRGKLTLTVRACVVRPPTMPGDAAAFLVIVGGPTPFARWTLRNEPWLGMFQTATYSVTLHGCGP